MQIAEFTEQCTELCHAIGVELPNNMTLQQYFNVFSYLSIDRFKEVVAHLKEYSQYKRFPLIFDFKKAADATYTKRDNYRPDKRENEEGQATAEFMQKLRKKFPGRRDKKPTHMTQVALIQKMYDEGKVYSLKLSKWVDKTLMDNIGGYFSEPHPKHHKDDISSGI